LKIDFDVEADGKEETKVHVGRERAWRFRLETEMGYDIDLNNQTILHACKQG
jgi:hypothetical protein